MKTEKLSRFFQNPDNPQKYGPDEIDALAASIRTEPRTLAAAKIAYCTDYFAANGASYAGRRVVIAGNKRLEALKQIASAGGLHDPALPDAWLVSPSGEVPAAWFFDLTPLGPESRRHWLLESNIGRGEWDAEKLLAQFTRDELSGHFDAATLDEILDAAETDKAKDGKTDADAVPDAPEKPISKRGEVYQCGEHRLMCGDATNAADVARLMDGEKADIAFTSPPYNAGGITFPDGSIFKHAGKKAYARGYQDSLSSEEYIAFASHVLEACFDNCTRFIFWNVSYNANSRSEYIAQIIPFLPRLIEQIAWKKTSAVPLKGSMRRAWEPIYLFSVTGECLPVGDVVSNVWEISNTGAQSEDHKAAFPIGLPEKGIEASGAHSVLDPFCGTGTTIIAAEKKGIRGFGMELDPHYCDVIRKRWAEFVHGEGCDWQVLAPPRNPVNPVNPV